MQFVLEFIIAEWGHQVQKFPVDIAFFFDNELGILVSFLPIIKLAFHEGHFKCLIQIKFKKVREIFFMA